jgi:SAM-dependent methyltransferase
MFSSIYPTWKIYTIDIFQELKSDIIGDICKRNSPLEGLSFDIIINQATLEHVYNPFQAMENLCNSLRKNGILITHTHPPNFGYHRYPSDCFRFMKDWWYDLPKHIENIRLLYLHMNNNKHVFSCYQKLI